MLTDDGMPCVKLEKLFMLTGEETVLHKVHPGFAVIHWRLTYCPSLDQGLASYLPMDESRLSLAVV